MAQRLDDESRSHIIILVTKFASVHHGDGLHGLMHGALHARRHFAKLTLGIHAILLRFLNVVHDIQLRSPLPSVARARSPNRIIRKSAHGDDTVHDALPHIDAAT